MLTRIVRLVLLSCVVALCLRPQALSAATAQQVDQSLAKAKAFLYSRQKNGAWEEVPARDKKEKEWRRNGGQWGGLTALATYALLAGGESYQDPRIQQAVEFLKKAEIVGTYATAMRCQVWLSLPQTPDIKAAMLKDAQVLLRGVRTDGPGRGKYGYMAAGAGNDYSNSRGHFGVLGMWAAAQAGIDVPDKFWQMVEKGWIDHQDSSGGWTYREKVDEGHPLSPGMTAAGIATLFVTQDYLHADQGVACKGNITNPSIEKGVKWLTKNLDKVATDQDYERDYPFETLYAVERVGVASGLKYLGNVNWYQKGADWLVKRQKRDGSWAEGGRGDVADSSFGVIFLARGRAPLVISKLEYRVREGAKDVEGMWNQRPRDVANVTRWIGREIENYFNWQIINLDAPAAELHDAPILYLAGNQALSFSEQHEQKLKQFLEEGGLVLANADCGSAALANSFRKLGAKLFPAYEFRELPEQHVIYTDQQFPRARWRGKPSALAMSNGVRELMILIPQADAAKAWQLNPTGPREDLYQLAADIFLYAVDKNSTRLRDQTHVVTPDPQKAPTRTLKVARIQYAGNWDPEPGGWRRLAVVLHNENGIGLQVEPVALGQGNLAGHDAAHMTGTTGVKLDETSKAELKKFVESGGTLVVDAAGGAAEFGQWADRELSALFPESTESLKQPLGPDHAVFAALKNHPVGYRAFARKKLGDLKSPRLFGIETAGRVGVFFSKEDLSAGLVGQSIDGISGYDPATATRLMQSILLHAGGKSAAEKAP